MIKIAILLLTLCFTCPVMSQMKAQVDKKSKEFTINSNSDPKAEYKIFGYQFANTSTKLMICFSSYTYDVTENVNKCPVGGIFRFRADERRRPDRFPGLCGQLWKDELHFSNREKNHFLCFENQLCN